MPNINLRKILIAFGLLVAAIGIGLTIYLLFFAPSEKEIELPPGTEGPLTGGLPSAGEGTPITGAPTAGEGVTPGLPTAKTIAVGDLTQNRTAGLTLSGDGAGAQYYDELNGLFYRVNADGSISPLSNKKFFQVKNVAWAPNGQKAVLEYPDGSNIVYDFETGGQTTLPKHWQDFEFTADNDRIISKSIGTDTENRWLIISDSSGNNVKIVSPLGENATKVQVAPSPDASVVGFARTGDPISQFGMQEIYLVGQNNENFKSLKVNGFNFSAQWAKEGDRVLYSITDPDNGYRPTLWAVDVTGDNTGSNPVKIGLDTWSEKCTVLTGYKAYCAVPKNLNEGVGLDPTLATGEQDIFYFINLKTGAKTFIGEPDNGYSVNSISVSQNEDYIYFTDVATGILHQMKIK